VLGDKLVRRSTREVMLTPQKLLDGSLSDYALGWGTLKEEGIATVGHGGGQQGTSTFILLAPDQRAGVVVLANMESVDVSSLATAMLKTVLGKL
jgi:Beta-lactamase